LSTEKSVSEHGDKIEADDKKAIEDAIAELKTALEGDDKEAIEGKLEVLGQASMKLGEAVYKAQAEAEASNEATPEPDASGGSAPGDSDDVVDADFEEVDDDKKSASS